MECNIELQDVITPLSCSSMVIEFIKYIAFQKNLIPYTYEQLKWLIDKKEVDTSSNGVEEVDLRKHSKYTIVSNKYFTVAKKAQESLDDIFKVITAELTSRDQIDEIVLLLGPNFTNPHHVYRLCIPSLDHSHLNKFHPTIKNCRSMCKTMFANETLNDVNIDINQDSKLHIMFKMKQTNSLNSHNFIQRNNFNLPKNGKQTVINFHTSSSLICSCKGEFFVYDDEAEDSVNILTLESNNSDMDGTSGWYQLIPTLKHFSITRYNGVPVADIWMNQKLLQ